MAAMCCFPFLDGEVSQAIATAMAANGVKFHWKGRVTHCDASKPDAVNLTFSALDSVP